MTTSESPRVSTLRGGITLASIVNAIAVAQNPDYARFAGWDGQNYVLNGGDGRLGAVTFDDGNEDSVVAVFFDPDSRHSPYRLKDKYDREVLLRGMPRRLRSVAEGRTLQYNRQDYQGELISLVTAAFWSTKGLLDAAVPWEDVLENGASLIRIELIENLDEALVEWEDAYQMSPEHVGLARSLFLRRMADPQTVVELSAPEASLLQSVSPGVEAMQECREAFAPLGIRVPLSWSTDP